MAARRGGGGAPYRSPRPRLRYRDRRPIPLTRRTTAHAAVRRICLGSGRGRPAGHRGRVRACLAHGEGRASRGPGSARLARSRDVRLRLGCSGSGETVRSTSRSSVETSPRWTGRSSRPGTGCGSWGPSLSGGPDVASEALGPSQVQPRPASQTPCRRGAPVSCQAGGKPRTKWVASASQRRLPLG